MKLLKKMPIWATVLIILLFVFFAFKAIGYAQNRYTCYAKWADSTIESKYTIRGGCLIKHNDNWIPSEVYRVN
ncbi:hypothetical protein [Marinomonas sp.]|uniref:hypothetical protein n=1 Tax=Marinomonas sp. TaxID=1904862 RepID=UPI003A94F6FB